MVVIRPTRDLAKRMQVKLTAAGASEKNASSTTRLGDWYGIDIVLQRKQFILAVSEKTRLAVILKGAPYATFPYRLPEALSQVLSAIGVSSSLIRDELSQMEEFTLAKTENRSILGTLNEYRFQLETWVDLGRANLWDCT